MPYVPTEPKPADGTPEAVVVEVIRKLTIRDQYDSRNFALGKYQHRKESSYEARLIIEALREAGFMP